MNGLTTLIIGKEKIHVKFCFRAEIMLSKDFPDIFNESKEEKINAGLEIEKLISACFYGYEADCFYKGTESKFTLKDFWIEAEKSQEQFLEAYKVYLSASLPNSNIPENKQGKEIKKKSTKNTLSSSDAG